MNTNTDGYPAPEARVREYVEAQAQEDARTGTTSDEIAWAVPDDGTGLRALAIGDLRDVLAELEAERAAHAETRRGRDRRPLGVERGTTTAHLHVLPRLDATDVHATPAQIHPANIADVPTEALAIRFHVLDRFYRAADPHLAVEPDPRCGCGEDGEGGRCFWDDPAQIDDDLGRRGR